MELLNKDKDVLHMDEFISQFLLKKICTKGFACIAGRLHYIRRFLKTHTIPYNLALSVMERHQQISDDDRSMKAAELTSLLHDIFYASDKLNLIPDPFNWQEETHQSPFDADHQASLLTCFLSTVFEATHSRCMNLLELKTALLLLCSTNTVEELVQHHLNLLIDHNRCIHQTRFKIATGAILKVFHRLDESVCSDPDSLSALVTNSFAKVTGLAGLSDTQFYQFWNTENRKNPTEISYLFSAILFSRSLGNSHVHQGVVCTGCQDKLQNEKEGLTNEPITGVRFKCTRCSSLNLCNMCFLGDYQNTRHNPTTHKFTTIEEPIEGKERDGHGKRGNLLAKLLKVFYFARNKRREREYSLEGEDDQTMVESDVKTIRFLDETPKNNGKKEVKKEGKDQLLTVIEMLSMENRLFQENLEQIQKTCNPGSEFHKYLEQHKNILTAQIAHLQEIWRKSGDKVVGPSVGSSPPTVLQTQKFHSTPFRRDHLRTINWDLTGMEDQSTLAAEAVEKSKHIRGEEMNKTYYDANRSDRSLQEISTWMHLRESFCRELISLPGNTTKAQQDQTLDGSGMQSFRELLHKVRDILEDTYSDNVQLSTVTRQLESALDDIIGEEERKFMVSHRKQQQQEASAGKRAGVKQA